MKLIFRIKNSAKIKKYLLLLIELSLFIYVFSLPSFGEKTSFVHYIIYAAMIVLGILSFCYSAFYSPIKLNAVFFVLLPFVLLAFIGTAVYSKNYRDWFTIVLLYLSFVIFIFSFVIINETNKVIVIISLGFFVFSLYYIFHYRAELLSFAFAKNGRMGSYFDNENAVSLYSLIGFTTAFYLVLFTKRKIRFLFLIPCITTFGVGITTGSRTFYLLFAIIIIVCLYFLFRKHKFIYLIVLAISIALLVGLLSLPFMATIRERLISGFETIFGTAARPDTSTIQRITFIDYGFYLGTKNIFIGYGCGGFSIFSGVRTYTHCNYAELICDFGILGLILFYTVLFIPLIYSYLYRMHNKQLIYVFVLFYVFFGIMNVFYYNKIYYLILAVLYYLTFCKGRANIERQKTISSVKKITFICDSLKAGGSERVISILANEFVDRNIMVSIVSLSNNEERFYYLSDRIDVVSLSSNGNGLIRFFKKLFKLVKFIKNDKPNIVISFLPLPNLYTLISCKFTKTKYVVSERNNPYKDPDNLLLRFLKELSFLHADGCVFQVPNARDYYCESIKEKSIVISNPINLEDISKASAIKAKTVTAVGRLTDQKNYKMLIDAYKNFYYEGHSDFVLNIYGEGSLKNELIDYCEKEKISDAVVFNSVDSKWIEKEKNTSMFILTSLYEGIPNSLLEALCSGIPCISTDCPIGGPAYLLKLGFSLDLVEIGDVCDLHKKMESSLDESHVRDALLNQERAVIFSKSNIVDKWIDFIYSIKKQPLF